MNPLLEPIRHGTPAYPFQIYHQNYGPSSTGPGYHWHPELEILMIQKGSLSVTDNQVTRVGTEGDLFFITPEHIHTTRSGPHGVTYQALLFPLSFLDSSFFDDIQNLCLTPLHQKKLLFPPMVANARKAYPEVWGTLQRILLENEEKKEAYQLATKAGLLWLFLLIFRQKLFLPENGASKRESPEHLENLRDILTYLHQHYQKPLDLSETARRFHLSPKYFSRYFHQNFGKTFTEYLNDYRLGMAAKLLSTTDVSVLNVAYAAGFENVSYFIRRFKAFTGCTPLQYRKLHSHL